jgi:pimeloyl-ACP methyl ester carboxylesterase
VPFRLDVPAAQQEKLVQLVRQAEIAVPSYYNTHTDASNTSSLGLPRDWLVEAQEAWTSPAPGGYSWRAEQKRLNRFPHFRINVTTTTTTTTTTSPDNDSGSNDDGTTESETFDLHFAALFSRNASATPLVMMHGWPGSWIEFAPVLDRLAARYTPDTLPYHVVVPSLPDYGLSTRSGELRRALTMDGAAAAIDGLMGGLGFGGGGGGYVAQGGDVGAILGQVLCAKFEACKALHCECGLGCFFGLDGLSWKRGWDWEMLTRW